jgi:hypothetical protein
VIFVSLYLYFNGQQHLQYESNNRLTPSATARVDFSIKNNTFDHLMVITMKSPALVLMTVNAPYCKQLSAEQLAHCLKDTEAAMDAPGHMWSFFGDVDPELQYEFAAQFGISREQVVQAARSFANKSGGAYPLAA